MAFTSNPERVRSMTGSVGEMMALIDGGYDLPIDNLHDMSPYLLDIQRDGGFLTGEQLWRLKGMLETAGKLNSFLQARDEKGILGCKNLKKELLGLADLREVSAEIERVVNKFGEVKDSASPALANIRREKLSAQGGISSAMKRVLSRAVAAGIIDKDVTPAMRDGRMVIPVESGKKRGLEGIVHDESASGKTSFIEPMEVVHASNRLRELEIEEQREVVEILRSVAQYIRPYSKEIGEINEILGIYDFIRAKALFAKEVDAQLPHISDRPELEWYNAFHPILSLTLRKQNRKIVPLTLHLDKDKRILIISGPNAGGKSVALKTVGIVQYMLQCGLIPTLRDNSHMGLFKSIFIDIGDEQSLENDLSTYSSHLRNMKYFLTNAGPRTLVLADEMGSGTEPQIGGALAQAIIRHLNRDNKCYGIITTHYQNLKTFADSEEGLVNGAMLYDRQNLQPLFEFSMGFPGSSFALEIANKTGLPHDVIDEAKNLVGSEYVNIDKYMLDIARDRKYWANKRLAIREKERKVEMALEDCEERAETLRSQRAGILQEAKEEARKLLSEVNAKIENTIHQIKKVEAEKEQTRKIRKELEQYKESLKQSKEDKEPEILKSKKKKPNKKTSEQLSKPAKGVAIQPGDYVRMSAGGVIGKVLSINGKKAEVAFGSLRTRVNLDQLIMASKPKPQLNDGIGSMTVSTAEENRSRQLSFRQEIDVRGMRADEALQAVAYFISDAVQFNSGRIRILHGTGTGALRSAIRDYLNSMPEVETFHDEDVRFGGAGITVVNLK